MLKETKKAGTILVNPQTKKIALVYREYLNDYSFPKGHLEKNETLLECALRETAEETKCDALVKETNPIYIEKYITPKGENVVCYYYLAYYNGKSDNKSLDTHPTIWLDFLDVENKLTYSGQKKMWNSLKDKIIKEIL